MKKRILSIFVFFVLMTTCLPATSVNIENNSTVTEHKPIIFEDQPFNRIIDFLMDRGHFPSISACIIKNDEMVWSDGFGFSDRENNIPATDKTVYQIASITKTVTGTALMQLYDQGLFDLDDDVNDFLPFELRNPNFPQNSITFRMLLSHSSSLRSPQSYWQIDLIKEGPPFPGYPSPWLEDYLTPAGSDYDPAVWAENDAPGEVSSYANINFDLVAYLVEILSGELFYEYCENHIFNPLEMTDTSFRLTDYDTEELAVPYFWNPLTKKHERQANFVFLHYPAGGLFTTVKDLSHFMIAHMNRGVYKDKRLLEEETVKEMHKIQPPGNKYSFYYGLAWLIMSRSIWIGFEYPLYYILSLPNAVFSGHGGDISYGLHTRMVMKLAGDTAVIFFINTHRIQRKGWNCAELLNDVLFLKANGFKDDDFSLNIFDYIIDDINGRANTVSFELIEDNIISNTCFINFIDRTTSIHPILKIITRNS